MTEQNGMTLFGYRVSKDAYGIGVEVDGQSMRICLALRMDNGKIGVAFPPDEEIPGYTPTVFSAAVLADIFSDLIPQLDFDAPYEGNEEDNS